MDNKEITIFSPKNQMISMKLTAGHFTTSNSHISHYIDMSELKSSMLPAKNTARELAIPYQANTIVDVIVCMEGTEILASYMAEELTQDGIYTINSRNDIYIVTPMSNVNGQLIFHQNVQERILNRDIILMVASVSSGKTIHRALDCLSYYGGNLVGISALFSAIPEISGYHINALFTCDDIPDYRFYRPTECDMCKDGQQIDAIVNSAGYTKI